MSRRVIWQGRAERIVAIGLEQEGEIILMMSSDCDSSGARSIAIPVGALASVAMALWAESLRRGLAALARSIMAATDLISKPAGEPK